MKNESTFIEAAGSVPIFFEKKILIIDNVELVARVVAAQLISAGFRDVRKEIDARNALDRITEFNPDMILLDIFMPHVSGLELLKTIRAESKFDHIVVLMLSSAGADEQYQSLEFGALGFIQKPTTAVNLVQTITSKFAIAHRLGIQ